MAATHVCSTNTTNTLGSRQTCIAHGIASPALRCSADAGNMGMVACWY